MSRFASLAAILIASISILLIAAPRVTDPVTSSIKDSIDKILTRVNIKPTPADNTLLTADTKLLTQPDIKLTQADKALTQVAQAKVQTTPPSQSMHKTPVNMAKSLLTKATIKPHRSSTRGHSDHGWLNTYHSFSFANWYNPDFTQFGALRVLNEDRVKANSGFPTHPHRDFEIFSYILSGELTHRDSMISKSASDGEQSNRFYRMHYGDVQFTTGGTGIAHSEMNEHKTDTVHFLQIWALPWKRGLPPGYHTKHFDEAEKRKSFVTILSPLKAGEDATLVQEKAGEPMVAGSIPIHADFAMGAGIIEPQKRFEWVVGNNSTAATKRKVYVHLPMTKNGTSKIRLDGREDAELSEGDGAFIEGVHAGDKLGVESIGENDAEVIILDTA